MFTFPEIKTDFTVKSQINKIISEINEFKEDYDDSECLDILHAAETLVRLHFKGKEKEMQSLVDNVIKKNSDRNYYTVLIEEEFDGNGLA